jgi:lipopolysaccharide biosynthesis glycosyltransferase
MVTDTIDFEVRDALIAEGCILQDVERLDPKTDIVSLYADPHYSEVWTKLRVWELETLTRAVLLDADMLLLKNMDELFELELPEKGVAACHSCKCNFHKKPKFPESWIPENCFYTQYEAAMGTADFGLTTPNDHFNAGLIVLQPNKKILEDLIGRIETLDSTRNLPFPEQNILNEYFECRWRSLPYIYNALKLLSFSHPHMWDINDIKNLHYILKKPWEVNAGEDNDYETLNKLWWDVYDTRRLTT